MRPPCTAKRFGVMEVVSLSPVQYVNVRKCILFMVLVHELFISSMAPQIEYTVVKRSFGVYDNLMYCLWQRMMKMMTLFSMSAS